MRFLNLHEYQSKDLLERYGAQVQKGKMAASAPEAFEVAKWIKTASALWLESSPSRRGRFGSRCGSSMEC